MLFYLVDVDYYENIILYGIDSEQNRVRLIDPSYRPSFLVLAQDTERALKEIRDLIKQRGLKVEELEVVRRALDGKEREFIRVYTKKAQDIQKIRDEVKLLEGARGGTGSVIDEFEYQLSPSRIYLAERAIECLCWYEILEKEGEIEEIKRVDREKPKLRVLAFDIEVVELERGSPSIVMISLYSEELKRVITTKGADYSVDTVVVRDERELLESFMDVVRQYDPDILVGYNSDQYDMPLLREKAKKLKVDIRDLSRDGSGITLSKRARFTTAKTVGRVHIDIFNFVFNVLSPILQTEELTLKSVAQELVGDTKLEMEYEEIVDAWKKGSELDKLAAYCLKDSELVFKLAEILLPEIEELTKITGQSLFDTSRMPYSQLVEWHYIKRAKAQGRVIPNQPKFDQIKERQSQSFEGGFVKEPEIGLHRNIAVVDFASLYPSIIATYNISVETLNCSCCKEDGNRVPELPYWFCKRNRGFESEVVERLLKERLELKGKLKSLRRDSKDYTLLDTKQRALKTIINATYGYHAYSGSRWYCKACAESVAAIGRYWIKEVLRTAEKKGLHAIYGDTDSAFLKYSVDKSEVLEFIDEINQKLPGVMRLDLEDFYIKGLFVPRESGGVAKKRYALLDEKGRLKIRGLEVVRRDLSRFARQTQQQILRLCLIDENVDGAFEYLNFRVNQLRKGEFELRELVVYEQLSKPLSEYKLTSPLVVAAKRLYDRGIPVNEGSVIGYVIQKGKGSISERAYPVELAEPSKIDIEYYIENQVIPASMRILNTFKADSKLF